MSEIVLGGVLPARLAESQLVSLMAFAGGWCSTLLYRVATRARCTSVATMLLAGITLGALAGATIRIITYMANDRQLRNLTFWAWDRWQAQAGSRSPLPCR